MNMAHWLVRAAKLYSTRPAIAHGTALRCDYATFAVRAARVAARLSEAGLIQGDRIGLFMVNRPDYLEVMWGVWWGGFCAVPINAKLHPKEAAWIVSHSGVKIVFADAKVAADLRAAMVTDAPAAVVIDALDYGLDVGPGAPLVERSETDPAWLFYTSGTTGRPKGVTLAARQLRWASHGYLANVRPVTPDEVMLHPAPLSHGGGLYHLPYVMQGALNVVPQSGGFDPAEIFALAAFWKKASFFAAPTMVRRLIDEARRTGLTPIGLSTITYGGGPMYLADILEGLEVVGPHFAQIYGQGESPMTITVLPSSFFEDREHPRYRDRLASVGFAQSMVEVAIRDSQGRDLPAGKSGEVCVRGDVVMEGYWNDPISTANAIRDGWLWTGDIGRMDEDGFVTLLDRSKDLVISGGTNIYPREVEEALLMHEAVAEVAIIGRADPEWGEVVVAYVVAARPVDAGDLDAHCIANIARFKRPKLYRFVDELPKNNYGKVLKTALREMESNRP
jgi:long-chain acyl-CoA synthetase